MKPIRFDTEPADSRTLTSASARRQELERGIEAFLNAGGRIETLSGCAESLEIMDSSRRESTLGDMGRGNAAAVGLGIDEAKRARLRRTAKRGGEATKRARVAAKQL